MTVYRLARTFTDPSSPTSLQRGFPSPGAGAQVIGNASYVARDKSVTEWEPVKPTKGARSWAAPTLPSSKQRGFAQPNEAGQMRGNPSKGKGIARLFRWGGVFQKYTPDYDRGAAAYVPTFGQLYSNPIGAGIVALKRPQATYGEAGQYINSAIWWSNRIIPTSIGLSKLNSAEQMAALLGTINVQAVVPVGV